MTDMLDVIFNQVEAELESMTRHQFLQVADSLGALPGPQAKQQLQQSIEQVKADVNSIRNRVRRKITEADATPEPPAASRHDVTPEDVVRALERRPELLDGVRRLLAARWESVNGTVYGVLKLVFPVTKKVPAILEIKLPPNALAGHYRIVAWADGLDPQGVVLRITIDVTGGRGEQQGTAPIRFPVVTGAKFDSWERGVPRMIRLTIASPDHDVELEGLRFEARPVRNS